MHKKISITLAIIAKNELESSKIIFPKIPKKFVDEIIYIDGKSTDGSFDYYKTKAKSFIQENKGLGDAMILARKKTSSDAIIFFHPDGNEDPEDIKRCADALRKGKKFVIMSRMIKGGSTEEDFHLLKTRKWLNKIASIITNILWNTSNTKVTDMVQGFRGIYCKEFDRLNINKTDSSIDFQMVIRALKNKIEIYEIPTKENQRLYGDTHFPIFPTVMQLGRMFAEEIIN